MDAEQTWPTEEELAEAEVANKSRKIIKIVPKGTSEYQAAWIPDEDGGITCIFFTLFSLFFLLLNPVRKVFNLI